MVLLSESIQRNLDEIRREKFPGGYFKIEIHPIRAQDFAVSDEEDAEALEDKIDSTFYSKNSLSEHKRTANLVPLLKISKEELDGEAAVEIPQSGAADKRDEKISEEDLEKQVLSIFAL